MSLGTYKHTQSSASSTWVVTHNLTTDVALEVIIGGVVVQPTSVVATNLNKLRITFSTPQTGTVRVVGTIETYIPIAEYVYSITNWDPLERGLDTGSVWASPNAIANNGTRWITVGSYNGASMSTDDGTTWRQIVIDSNGTYVNSIVAIESGSSNVWLAASVSQYRSTDNGNTWSTLSPAGLNSGNVSASFRSFATDGNGVWVGVGTSGYCSRSTDNGATWSALTQGLNSGLSTADFQSVATDGNGVWVAVATNTYRARSTDNGATWSSLNTGGNTLTSVATDGNGVWVVVGSSGVARRSTDNGVNWTGLTTGLNNGGNATATINGITTDGSGNWVASIGTVAGSYPRYVRSADNGATWTSSGALSSIPVVAGFLKAARMSSTGTLLIATSACYGEAIRSTDAGVNNTVLAQKSLRAGAGMSSIKCIDNNGAGKWMAISLYNSSTIAHSVTKSTDNGYTWYSTQSSTSIMADTTLINPGSLGFTNILHVTGSTWVLLSGNGNATRTTNDGTSWSSLTQGLNSGLTTAVWRGSSVGSSNVVVAVAQSGYCARSTDNGATWTSLTQGLNSGLTTANFRSVATNGAGVWVAVADSGYCARSTNNGASWSALTKGLNCGSTTASFQSVATDGAGVWVATTSTGYCARSTDNGASWSALTRGLNCGLTTAIINSVATNNTGVWVAVSGNGYCSYSINNGADWIVLEQGLNSGAASAVFKYVSYGNNNWIAVADNGWASINGPIV
jgi:hypothetical protein